MNVGWLDIDKYEPGPFVADIDECTIPELAAKCVDNAECCNLPAEYVCKCKQGFEGDGQVECRGESSSPVLVLLYPNNAMQHTSINRSLQSFLTLYFLFSFSKSYLFSNELDWTFDNLFVPLQFRLVPININKETTGRKILLFVVLASMVALVSTQ